MKRRLVVAIIPLIILHAPCGATPPRPVFLSEAVCYAAEFQEMLELNESPSLNILRMRMIAAKMTDLGIEQAQRHEWDSAEHSLLTALHINETIEDSDSKRIADDLSNLIGLYLAQDKYTSAEPLIERFFKDFHHRPLLSQEFKKTEAAPVNQTPRRTWVPSP
jgi:hypothetical protein